jgi:hypothetical protein
MATGIYERLAAGNTPPVSKTPDGVPSISNYEKVVFSTPNPGVRKGEINAGYYPSSAIYRLYNDDMASFKPFYPTVGMPLIAGNPDAYESRARNQSGWWLTGHTAAQTIGEIVGGTVSSVGALINPVTYAKRAATDTWASKLIDTGGAFEKNFLEQVGDYIQTGLKEQYPIYTTQKAQQGVAPGDATWWAEMTPSMASMLSIMIPARLASFLPAKLARAVGARGLGAAAKLLEEATVAGKGLEEAGAIASRASVAAMRGEYWTNVLSSAVAGRVIDSTRESLGKYDQYYQEMLAQGYSDSDAKKYASEAAADGFRKSHVNLIFDLVEWGAILKTGNYLTKGLDEQLERYIRGNTAWSKLTGAGEAAAKQGVSRFRTLAGEGLKTTLAEGADEMTMDVFQNEGKYTADRKRGLTDESTFSDRLYNHIINRKNWDSFIGGALGGLFMMPLGIASEHIFNKTGINRIKERAEGIVRNAEEARVKLQDLGEAIKKGSPAEARALRNEYIATVAAKSMSNNSLKYDIEMLKSIKNMSPAQIEEQGINPDIVNDVDNIVDGMNKFETIFNNVSAVRTVRNKERKASDYFIANQIALAQFNKESYKNELDLLESKLFDRSVETNAVKSKLSDVELEYYNTLRNNDLVERSVAGAKQANDAEIQRYTKILNDTTSALANAKGRAIVIAQSNIASAKSNIDSLNKANEDNQRLLDKHREDYKTIMAGFDGSMDKDAKARVKALKDEYGKDLQGDPFRLYNALKATYNVYAQNLAKYNTEEGEKFLDDMFNKAVDYEVANTKDRITKEVDATKTAKDVDTLVDKYKKDRVPSDVYETIVKAKRKIIKDAELKAKQEEAIRNGKKQPVPPVTTATRSEDKSADTTRKGEEKDSYIPTGEGRTDTTPDSAKPVTVDPAVVIAEAAAAMNSITSADFKAIYDDIQADDMFAGSMQSHVFYLYTLALNNDLLKAIGAKTKFSIKDIYDNKIPAEDKDKVEPVLSAIEALGFAINNYFDIIQDPANPNKFNLISKNKTITGDELSEMFREATEGLSEPIVDSLFKSFKKHLDLLETVSNSTSLGDVDYGAGIKKFQDLHTVTLVKAIDDYLAGISNDVTQIIGSARFIINAVIKKKIKYLGTTPNKINYIDILKWLRDQDDTNATLFDGWFGALFGLKTLKSYYNAQSRNLETLLDIETNKKKPNTDRIAELKFKIADLQAYGDMLDVSGLQDIEIRNRDNIVYNEKQFTIKNVYAFLEKYPREYTRKPPLTGMHVALNIYDKNGNPVDVNDIEAFDEDNMPDIYKHLDEILPGTEVILEVDDQYLAEAQANGYDFGDVPIRVKLKGSDDTILWVNTLSYRSNGYQYGKRTVINGQVDYQFRGMNTAMRNSDYSAIASDLNKSDSLLKKFYINYTKATRANLNDKDVRKANVAYKDAYDAILRDAYLNEMFGRIANHNLDTPVDKPSEENIARVLDTIFYGIKSYDYEDYVPSARTLEQVIVRRDNAFRNNFYLTKHTRQMIKKGAPITSTIDTVSTPSILIRDQLKEEGKNKPRATLDKTIKPVDLGDGEGPRIVIIRYNGTDFIDLRTGNVIKHPKFDRANALANWRSAHVKHHSPLAVLVEAPDKTLHAFDVKTNTIGLSGDEEERRAMIDTVENGIVDALTANTGPEVNKFLEGIRHITIYDKNRKLKEGETDKGRKYLDTYTHFEEDGKNVTLKLRTHIGNVDVYVTIENNNGVVNVYRSRMYTNVDHKNDQREVFNIAKQYKDDNLQNIDINTPEGKVTLMRVLDDIVPTMLRQAHVDLSTNTYSYEKGYDGGEVTDTATDTTYKSAEKYYINTGALYSDVGAVYDSKGNVITNFDITGRAPMSVSLNIQGAPREAKSYSSVDELVKDNIIAKDDEYLPLIKEMERSVSNVMREIKVTGKPTKDEDDPTKGLIASTVQSVRRFNKRGDAIKYSNQYTALIHDTYFVLKSMRNPLGPASLNILHEMVHMYMNSRYHIPINESLDQYSVRHALILEHNREIKNFIDTITPHWRGMADERKAEVVRKALPTITDKDAVKEVVRNIDQIIGIINKDVADVEKSIAKKTAANEKLNHLDTIQEVITYAFTDIRFAAVLNAMETDRRYDTGTLRGRRKTFWQVLKEKFFDILKRLFNITYNDRSEFAHLHSIVEELFRGPVKPKTAKGRAAAEIEPDTEETTTTTETPTGEKPIETITETEVEDAIDDLGSYLDIIPPAPDVDEDLRKDNPNKQSATAIGLDVNDDASLQTLMGLQNIMPTVAILDANKLPIC